MIFLVNNSPFAGRENGDPRKVEANRLQAELQTDVFVLTRLTSMINGQFQDVGNCTLSILIETMRREASYELQVSRPEVIKEIDGVKCEPFEHKVKRYTRTNTKDLLSKKPFLNVR